LLPMASGLLPGWRVLPRLGTPSDGVAAKATVSSVPEAVAPEASRDRDKTGDAAGSASWLASVGPSVPPALAAGEQAGAHEAVTARDGGIAHGWELHAVDWPWLLVAAWAGGAALLLGT